MTPPKPDEPAVAQTVFAIVSFGAVMLTINVVLLGGNIGFFQVRTAAPGSCPPPDPRTSSRSESALHITL